MKDRIDGRIGRGRWAVVAVGAVALLTVGALAAAWTGVLPLAPEPAAGTPVPPGVILSAEERDFYDYVAPRLRALAAESRLLAEMGRARNRDLLELQQRGARVDEVAEQIEGYVAAHETPPRFVRSMAFFGRGAAGVRRAIAEARAGFTSFDWDRVGRAVDLFEQGADDLRAASDDLQRAVGAEPSATPTAGVVR